MKKVLFLTIINITFLICLVSSLSVNSVFVDSVSPGQEGVIKINIENEGNEDADSLSFSLEFPTDSNIIPIGSSEAFVNELKEDDDETFAFKFRVANTLSAGTYSIKYKINYEERGDKREQIGTIGIVVSAQPELQIEVDSKNPIIGKQGEISVRVVNKGLADARFVYLSLESEDLTILSEKSEYIGSIDSDDFETSNFDVIFNEKFSTVKVVLNYKDFNNQEKEIIKTASLRVYTNQEAIEKGILKKNNATIYVGFVLLLLILWILYRTIRKRRKNKI